jgi:hypothetical protein
MPEFRQNIPSLAYGSVSTLAGINANKSRLTFKSYNCNENLSIRKEALHLLLQNFILNSPESHEYETEPLWCAPKRKLGRLECVGHSFAYVAHFVFFREMSGFEP